MAVTEAGLSAQIVTPRPERGDVEPIAEMVRLARAGDREAFAELYRVHHASISRLAGFYLNGCGEDAVAETFVRAWKSLRRYKVTGAPFSAWLYAIARNVVADELRRKRRIEPRDVLPDSTAPSGIDDRLALSAAIARLPKEQRQVIELKYLIGLKNPEVAEALGRSVGAVNALQWRALRRMKELLS